MKEIRLVGRGGQGVVTAGELLGRAAVHEGRHAQAIPAFGPERRGALSSCTVRISDGQIRSKFSGTSPDVVVALDSTIWRGVDVLLGLREGSSLIFNTADDPASIDAALRGDGPGSKLHIQRCTLYCVDATGIALEMLGRPITNTALLGALSGATELVQMGSIERVFAERFGSKADANVAAARAARERLQRLPAATA